LSALVGIEHHGIDTAPAERLEPLLRCREQGGRNALAAMFWRDREAVQVAAPAVPGGDQGTDDDFVELGDQHGLRVAFEQPRDAVAVITDALAFGGGTPEAEQLIDVG
jgi:hypothetical protein